MLHAEIPFCQLVRLGLRKRNQYIGWRVSYVWSHVLLALGAVWCMCSTDVLCRHLERALGWHVVSLGGNWCSRWELWAMKGETGDKGRLLRRTEMGLWRDHCKRCGKGKPAAVCVLCSDSGTERMVSISGTLVIYILHVHCFFLCNNLQAEV